MNFKPKTEDELQRDMLWPDGEYDFDVQDAVDKVSKAGNEMIQVTLRCYDANGSERLVADYLMEQMAFKLRNFCAHTGLIGKYEAGTLEAADCIAKSGRVQLRQRFQEGFPAKMEVKNYVKAAVEAPAPVNLAPQGPPRMTQAAKAYAGSLPSAVAADDNIPF